MVERSQRGKGKHNLLGSHQKCWIWGRNVVLETLRSGKWLPVELLISDQLPAEQQAEATQRAQKHEIALKLESPDRLKQLCKSGEHQGYLAKMPPFPYDDADSLLESLPENPFYVILDSIQDPFNFGAIVRCADAMGVNAVFIPENEQVEVTSLVTRTSAGAVNHVPIAKTRNLCTLVRKLQSLKVAVVAASEKSDQDLFVCDFQKPTAILIGNEGSGISRDLLRLSDSQTRIPQHGQVGSLNAAVSAGILFYEVQRQRNQES